MATTFLFDGTDATQDLSFLSASAGTVASATDQAYTGPRSLKLSTGAGPTLATATFLGVLADAGRRISFRYRASVWTSTPDIIRLRTSGDLPVFNLRRANSPANVLDITGSGAGSAFGSTTLVANTWYRITLAYTVTNATTFQIKVYLNGVLEATLNTGTLTNIGTSRLVFVAGVSMGANQSGWFDDLYIDDGTDSADPGTTDVNSLRVTNKRAFANGTTNGFSTQIGAGGSGYGSGHAPQVNEQPLSQTNGWSMVGAGAAVTEEYTIEGASVGDVDISALALVGYSGWVLAKSLASETGQIKVDGNASNIALTSTATLFTKAYSSTTYPAGGTDIGVVTDTSLTTVSLYEAGVLVAFNPAAGRIFKLAGEGGGLIGEPRGLVG